MWDRFIKTVGIALVVIFLVVLSLQVMGVLGSGCPEAPPWEPFVNEDC